ncbi:ATP-binding protein [bacterium]|nr:ATP-binding protein [bacterium]
MRVLGRADGLQQLFANLLVNAAQAIEDGGKVRLALSTLSRLGAEEDNWVEVSVEDEGPGIPPENLTRIFEDFFTTKRGSGGSGLGLAICRQIAEEHRGSIRAENREGGGARFVVGLPIHDRQSRSRND